MARRPLLAPFVVVFAVAIPGVAPATNDPERIPRAAPATQQGGTPVVPRGYPFAPRSCDRLTVYRRSRALGRPFAGRLVRGVRLPRDGCDYFTWDFPLQTQPNRHWRRWGTDYLIRKILRVLKRFREAHPEAPRIGIGDLSRRHGGIFDERFGGLGHDSHQNGRDIDISYPRKDRLEQAPQRRGQVDRTLSQDLVRRFVRAHVQYVFVGPRLGLRGPPRIVQSLALHDDHMHVRVHARKARRR
ncbi:MAG: penicillin-insensitive murein endopeptidase [Thermoleophilaceae bacterium]|nr:penicillin-insensitive murein endopeptidase [Thermoleophilaceae bacterium]